MSYRWNAFLPLLKFLGFISNFKMSSTNQRIVPLIITFVIYLSGYYFILHFPIIPDFLKKFLLATVVVNAITLIVSSKWKISLHMIGIGGVTGLTIALASYHPLNYHLYLMGVFLLSGIIGTLRLYLDEHNALQIYTGYALGFLTVLLVILIY